MAKTVGAVIREVRAELGLSMRDLARKTGMTTSYLSMLETGARKDPGFGTVLRIARGLGVSVEDLALRLEGRPAGPKSAASGAVAAAARVRKARAALAQGVGLLDEALEKIEPSVESKKARGKH